MDNKRVKKVVLSSPHITIQFLPCLFKLYNYTQVQWEKQDIKNNLSHVLAKKGNIVIFHGKSICVEGLLFYDKTKGDYLLLLAMIKSVEYRQCISSLS